MFETMPVSITAFFVADECEATLRIAADSTRYVDMSIIHDSGYRDTRPQCLSTATIYSFSGDGASPKIAVADKDIVIILAQQSDSLIATQIFEVDLSMAESTGYLLIPRGGYNLLVDQESMTEDEMCKLPTLSIHGPFEVAS